MIVDCGNQLNFATRVCVLHVWDVWDPLSVLRAQYSTAQQLLKRKTPTQDIHVRRRSHARSCAARTRKWHALMLLRRAARTSRASLCGPQPCVKQPFASLASQSIDASPCGRIYVSCHDPRVFARQRHTWPSPLPRFRHAARGAPTCLLLGRCDA